MGANLYLYKIGCWIITGEWMGISILGQFTDIY